MTSLNLPDVDAAARTWAVMPPFPHVVIPDAISHADAHQIAVEFPLPDDPAWKTYTGPLEAGKQEASADSAGPYTAQIHAALAATETVDWLRTVTGIPDLVPDPARLGGGIHQSGPDGRLGMHVDFNVHPAASPPLIRAVNVILFVTDPEDLRAQSALPDGAIVKGPYVGWDPGWAGLLRIGVPGSLAETAVMPNPGVMIVFEASGTSWHGHPDVMAAGAPLRRSIPAYYYRPVREDEEVDQRSTRFLEIEQGRCPHDGNRGHRCALCGGHQ